jgi:hypothetical protein
LKEFIETRDPQKPAVLWTFESIGAVNVLRFPKRNNSVLLQLQGELRSMNFRIRSSDPPRAKFTSLIKLRIRQMPRPWDKALAV